MRCVNCGTLLADDAKFCSKCGTAQMNAQPAQNETEKKKSPLKAVIALLLVIAIVAGGTAVYFIFFAQQNQLEKKLKGLTDKGIIEFYYDDFNSDKTKEAFAVTGKGGKDGFSDGEIWFVSDNAGKKIKEEFDGSCNGILEEDGKKYISVEVENEDDTSLSYIYGVEDKDECFEPEISGQFSHVHQDGDKIVTDGNDTVTVESFKKTDEKVELTEPEVTSVTEKPEEETTSRTTKKTTAAEKPKTSKKETAENGWRAAYKKYLKNYYDNNGSGSSLNTVKFSLGYVDNDDIPELFVSSGDWHYASVNVVTYRNGALHDFGPMGCSYGEIEYYRKEGLIIEEGGGSGVISSTVSKMSGNSITKLIQVTSGERYDSETDTVINDYWISDALVSKEQYENEYNKYLSESKRASAVRTGREGLVLTLSNIERIDTMNAR